MEPHLKFIGILLMALAFMHIFFPKYFQWKTELSTLSLLTREMMYVHTFFVALVVFLMGLLCFTSAQDLMLTTFGKKIALGFGIFWAFRLIMQFFGYSSALWKGKAFETAVHIFFSILWIYLSIVFIWVYLS